MRQRLVGAKAKRSTALTVTGLAAAGTLVAAFAVSTIAASGGLRGWLVAAAVVVVCVLASGSRRLVRPWTTAVVLLAIGPFVLTSHFVDPTAAVARLVVLVALVGTLARLVSIHRVGLPACTYVDGGNVLVGGALGAWIVVAGPLIDRGEAGAATAVLVAASLPLCFLALMMAGLLVSSGLHRSPIAWAIMLLVGLGTVGHAVVGLAAVHVVDGVPVHLIRAILITATFGAAVALIRPTAMHPPGMASTPLLFRIRMRSALVIGLPALPIVLVAAVPAASTTDRVVRTVGTILLTTLSAWRVVELVDTSQRAEGRLHDRSGHDDLTRLPNRRQFVTTTTAVLDTTWRTEHRPVLVHISIDRFMNLNDSLGHDGANRILLSVAERLRALGEAHGAVVARLSGDEFALLDPGTTDDEGVERAEDVRQCLVDPVDVDGREVFVTASIGVVTVPRSRTITADEFLRRADIAMHRAKSNGRNCIAVFDDSMQATLANRMDIEHALYGAIERQELRLAYQPIVDIDTGEMSGFEALIRWERADGTMVRPDQFIPIAEEIGIIDSIGAWALGQALDELRRWIDDGIVTPTTTMSVNVSPRQFADSGFADIVRAALASTGVPPELLWLEVTESMMLSEPQLARTALRQIRAMGVRIALDDFGTGFSSLSLLQGFPLQRLKIDRAFVHGLAENGNDRALVRTIIAMGNSLGLDIVAEGVESVEQLMTLRELDCPKAQGYLISRPVPADAISSTMLAMHDFGSLSMFAGPAPAGSAVATDAGR